MSRTAVLRLAEACAPTTPAQTLASLAQVESGFDPLTIHDNTTRKSQHPRTTAAAVGAAAGLIARGHNIDLGLAQINSANLNRLQLELPAAFDACRSLEAAGRVLNANYVAALTGAPGAPLLQTAYSIYNTGQRTRGFRNGYADRIVAATQRAAR